MTAMFEVIPAIDLLDGKVVRLEQGDYERVVVYGEDPVGQARQFAEAGASRLHVVDLEGARSGRLRELKNIALMVNSVPIPIQVGGGIRHLETVQQLIEVGVDRVILGTAALTNPDLIRSACERYRGRVFVSIDAKNGYVATEGWRKTSQTRATELIKEAGDWGVHGIVYTDIATDGMLQGPNFAAIQQLAASQLATSQLETSTSLPIIASGGITTLQDIERLRKMAEVGVIGCIVGKALYEGRLTAEKIFMKPSL